MGHFRGGLNHASFSKVSFAQLSFLNTGHVNPWKIWGLLLFFMHVAYLALTGKSLG